LTFSRSVTFRQTQPFSESSALSPEARTPPTLSRSAVSASQVDSASEVFVPPSIESAPAAGGGSAAFRGIGGLVGALVVVAVILCVGAFFWLRRRRRRGSELKSDSSEWESARRTPSVLQKSFEMSGQPQPPVLTDDGVTGYGLKDDASEMI
jgi:hypothetical protein